MSARQWRFGGMFLLAVCAALTACNQLGAIGYYLRPRQIQKPLYEFPANTRVAMLIEAAVPAQENPVFNQALYERSIEMLREGKCEATFVPLREVIELRQRHADFTKWSVQRVGKELGADQVLYVKLDSLTIRPTPDHPLLTPAVSLHLKVIGVAEPSAHARLWPEEREGFPTDCKRQVNQTADENPDGPDIEARKLGHDTAYWVTMPFLEVDLEENPPVER